MRLSRIDGPVKDIWKKSKIIRPLFWKAYRYRPRAILHRRKTDEKLDKMYPDIYREAAKAPVDERKAVFFEPRYMTLCASMELIYKRMEADPRFDVSFFFIDKQNKEPGVIPEKHAELVREIATAKYLFLSDNSTLIGCLPMRRETVYVQLWHACGAFKGFGMTTAKLNFGENEKRRRRHPAYKNTDIVTVSSPEICWAYAEAMDLPESCIYPIGVSRTDVFFDRERLDGALEKVWEKFPAAKGKKIILFAPTFRGHLRSAATVTNLDIALFQKELGEDYVLIIKHHPVVRHLPPVPEELDGVFVYDATQEMEIEDLLMAADVCITDYSSIIFEYSLMRRPMLFYAYDLEEYYDWRGFYYPYKELTPGPICKTNEELVDYIRHLDERFDVSVIDAFRERFMSACDGHSTERILETAVALGVEKEQQES